MFQHFQSRYKNSNLLNRTMGKIIDLSSSFSNFSALRFQPVSSFPVFCSAVEKHSKYASSFCMSDVTLAFLKRIVSKGMKVSSETARVPYLCSAGCFLPRVSFLSSESEGSKPWGMAGIDARQTHPRKNWKKGNFFESVFRSKGWRLIGPRARKLWKPTEVLKGSLTAIKERFITLLILLFFFFFCTVHDASCRCERFWNVGKASWFFVTFFRSFIQHEGFLYFSLDLIYFSIAGHGWTRVIVDKIIESVFTRVLIRYLIIQWNCIATSGCFSLVSSLFVMSILDSWSFL